MRDEARYSGRRTPRRPRAMTGMPSHTLIVNGRRRSVEADPDTPLLSALRDTFGLTGTTYGRAEGVCGACTIHDSGRAARACMIPIAAAAGRHYTTIDGLGEGGLHPYQSSWLELDVSQCGFCQPGMIMAAAALLAEAAPAPSARAASASTRCRWWRPPWPTRCSRRPASACAACPSRPRACGPHGRGSAGLRA